MNARSWFIDGRMRLMTMSFSKPATLFCRARKSSAIPPVASLRSSVYLPKRAGIPSIAGSLLVGIATTRCSPLTSVLARPLPGELPGPVPPPSC